MNYQQIDVGGFYHSGKDRTEDYYQMFPEKPIGKTILDIGCCHGFYSIKAVYEGAEYALGVDNHEPFLSIGREAIDFLGCNVEFKMMNVLKEKLPDKQFDIVLCLNLVHHFKNIDQVNYLFDELYKRCNEKMIFEVLTTNKDWEIKKNYLNNAKIHLGVSFFEKKYGNAESMDSKVTEGRKIIIVRK